MEHDHDDKPATPCRFCHFDVVTDDWVYSCPSCGAESCPDCAGKCGCDVGEGEEAK